jgi:2-dehydropantoate 2-reductase
MGRDYEASTSKDPLANLSINDITKPGDPDYERYKYLRSTVAALQLLEDLNVSWKPISHIQLTMRRKLVVNSVINPLTALMRCRNGEILQSPAGKALMSRVCQEAANVFAAQMEAETMVGEDEDFPRLPPMLMAKNLEQEVTRVANLTANNKSSMLTDVEKGRSTELDYINGYIMRLGALYKVPVPTTTTLYHLIKMRTSPPLDQAW